MYSSPEFKAWKLLQPYNNKWIWLLHFKWILGCDQMTHRKTCRTGIISEIYIKMSINISWLCLIKLYLKFSSYKSSFMLWKIIKVVSLTTLYEQLLKRLRCFRVLLWNIIQWKYIIFLLNNQENELNSWSKYVSI